MAGVITELISRVAFEPRPGNPEDEGQTRIEAVVRRVFSEAEGGSLKAAEMIFDRMEGKVATNVSPELALRTILEMSEGELASLFQKYKLGGADNAKLLLDAVASEMELVGVDIVEEESFDVSISNE